MEEVVCNVWAFQEAYFSGGDFSPQEELVAGSPEYAFNEYLQIAVEWESLCCYA